MIEKVGILCQDRTSYGFLAGIARRLRCQAEFIEPPGGLAKSTTMTRRQAKIASLYLAGKGVDLIVRFTDADRNRWQDIKRHEQCMFESDSQSMLVCGVAVENTEDWLALDTSYLSSTLNLQGLDAIPVEERVNHIKAAIARSTQLGESMSERAAAIVANAPVEVFRRWLAADDSLRAFYMECRQAAIRNGCTVPNELDDGA